TKTSATGTALAHRIRRRAEIDALPVETHQRRLVETAWRLGGRPELHDLNLRRFAHTFGYRGHMVTKSRYYSTTFGALRRARADYCRRTGRPAEDEAGDVRFGYAGQGYDDPAVGFLAYHLASLATEPAPKPVTGA